MSVVVCSIVLLCHFLLCLSFVRSFVPHSVFLSLCRGAAANMATVASSICSVLLLFWVSGLGFRVETATHHDDHDGDDGCDDGGGNGLADLTSSTTASRAETW